MIQRDVSLKRYNTFGLDYRASCFNTIKTEKEAISFLKEKKSSDEPLLILGAGSNLLFIKDFEGTIIHPEIEEVVIEEQKKEFITISSGAGILWDELVKWTVQQGLGGLENLSLIPGTVGASPVQNIGAYGVEVRETIEKVRTISISDGSIKEFSNEECRFSYRNSIFKDELKGKHLVTRVFFKLNTQPKLKTEYGTLKEEVRKLGPVSLNTVRRAVIKIRRNKLPDPQTIGNAGSFFKNPVIESSVADNLLSVYPDIPYYNDIPGHKKISAGWLIDQCGWKGKRIGNAGVHDKQALVLVNYGRASGKELLDLSIEIAKSVSDKFGIELQREVEVV